LGAIKSPAGFENLAIYADHQLYVLAERIPWLQFDIITKSTISSSNEIIMSAASKNNFEIRKFKNCILVEGLWGKIKHISKHICNYVPGDVNIEDYLFESLLETILKILHKTRFI
jgi:hypothetical protein